MGAVARAYVKAARAFVIILVVTTAFVALANAQSATLNLVVTSSSGGTKCATACLGTLAFVSGNLTVTGDYEGPVYLFGQATVMLANTPIGSANSISWSWTSGFQAVGGPALPSNGYFNRTSLNESRLTFYSQEYIAAIGTTGPSFSGTVAAYSDPAHTKPLGEAVPFSGGSVSANPTYVLGIQVPLINDTMLGAGVPQNDSQGNPNPVFPESVGGIYNFLMVIALIVIAIGAAVALFTGQSGPEKGGGLSAVLMQVVIGVVIVIIFPLVYNNVASLVNYTTQTIIAYPQPPLYYNVAIQNLWTAATAGGGSWATIITSSLIDFAVWIMELIASIMIYFLGTVRVLLFAVMIVGFPLAVGLKMIPFASKLGQMVEDTLFGLMLAAIMSAVIAGVANQIINSQPNWVVTALGDQPNWLAIAAIFAIILMPTVFAPLTSTLMQTVSQTAMMGGGIAAATAMGAGMPAASGAVQAVGPAMGAFRSGVQSGTSVFGGISAGLQNAASTFGSVLKRQGTLQQMASNAALIGTTGLLAATGSSRAASTLRMAFPTPASPQERARAALAAQQQKEAGPLLAQHDQTFNRFFTSAGSISAELNAQMKQALGNHYYDVGIPAGREAVGLQYHRLRMMTDPEMIDHLSRHGQIDSAMYKSNPAYRQGIDSKLQELKQKFNQLDPRLDEGNYQKVADVLNQINLRAHAAK
jgi:hypothetical protein